MDLLTATDYDIARLILQRGVGLVYLLAFVAVLDQFRPLLGERGLLPVPAFLRSGRAPPTVFSPWGYSDGKLTLLAWLGVALSTAVVAGLTDRVPLPVSILVWLLLYAAYLSIVNVGQTFYSFGWESLLLETGFYAAFLGNARVGVPLVTLLAFRWLLFRVEFGAGMIKMRGDPCWRDLTCLEFHHETQPMPNPLSRWFHLLPRPLHRLEVAANHVAQLVAPFALFLPQPVAGVAAGLMIVTQAYLMVSGNYAWLNFITLLLGFSAIPDRFFESALGFRMMDAAAAPEWFHVLVAAMALGVVALSWWPIRNLIRRTQLMNYSFNRLHLVNTYGAFGSVTRRRYEVLVEGTRSPSPGRDAEWKEYPFRGKPGDPGRVPRQWAPYHLRLDWLMWFAALSPDYARGWFIPFLRRLLAGDGPTLRLLAEDPFPDAPPRYVRARLFSYRFTTPDEKRKTGWIWIREVVGDYVVPMSLEGSGRPTG